MCNSLIEVEVLPERIKGKWGNPNVVKTFLGACIHEVTINGWNGRGLKDMSWKKIGEILKAAHNFSVNSNQMQNYFNLLKGKYGAWVSLKNKTGNKYDPSTNMFNLTDKEWETVIKEIRMTGKLRNAPLWFPDLCAQLFDIPEPKIQKEAMYLVSPSSSYDPVQNKQKIGEVTHEPQLAVPLIPPAAETSSPLAATVEQQTEPMVEVPPELPQIHPAIETKPEVPTELPDVQTATAREATTQMEVEEYVVRTGPDPAFSRPDLLFTDRTKLFTVSKNRNEVGKYKAWVSLKNKTGNKYDPPTNTFNLTDKEWETEIKKNKCIEELRKVPLPFPDLCAQLFDGSISTGFFQIGIDL
ncbi:unnamed protein product [Lactuca virosa]|uniref:Myb/SANT-like domain-containing protein n=1 Tax=Lactuca virosa TaxID=75947 RepID=A0AAU9PH54_9ASTR|nr:unnamed protein product [Lactuca virosa]